MALSNIFNEPKREITETVVGLSLIGIFVAADYSFALWFQDITGGPERGVPWWLGIIAGVSFGIAGVLMMLRIHTLGERVCDSLQRHGIHLRPKRRRVR